MKLVIEIELVAQTYADTAVVLNAFAFSLGYNQEAPQEGQHGKLAWDGKSIGTWEVSA